MTWSYLKIAFRAMKKYKVQHFITITAIAVGFTCFIMGAYWYYWEHRFDTFHPEHDRIYALTTHGLFRTADGKPAERHQIHFSVEQEITGFPEIESSTRTFWNSYYDENGQRHMGLAVDTLFFSYFFSDFIEGTWIGIPFNYEYIVLTESMARRQFGDVYCVGERLQTEQKSYIVAGVIKEYPANTEFLFEYLLLGTPGLNSMERAQTYVKVHRGTDMKEARQKVEQLKYKGEVNYKTRDAEEWSFRLRSLPEIHLTCNHELDARFRNIGMLVLAGVLAFFSALINHLVLFIGQQRKRSLHNHTLSVIGAGTGSLVWKTVCELLLSLAVSFVLILVLIELVFPFFQNYTRLDGGEGMYMGYERAIGFGSLMWTTMLVYLFCIVIYVGISLIPAVGMLRNRNTILHTRWRRVLVALQVGIGSFFFVVSLGMLWQFRFINKTDKGIRTDYIYQLRLGHNTTVGDECTAICEELKASAYIEDVTRVYCTPVLLPDGQFHCGSFLFLSGRDLSEEGSDNMMITEKNFPDFFGITLQEGEWPALGADEQYAINETFARRIGLTTLSDKSKTVGMMEGMQKPHRVTAIIKDYHYAPFYFPVDNLILRLYHPDNGPFSQVEKYIYVKVVPGAEKEALEYIRLVYDRYEKGEITPEKQIVSLTAMMDAFNEPERKLFQVFSLLSLASILISSFGIYTLVSFSAEQRRREIAIRKVNGAGFADIFKLFTREYVWLALIGNALALPLSYIFLINWLEEYTYRINPGVGLFLLVFCITSLIVVVSVALRMRQAAAANPAEAARVI